MLKLLSLITVCGQTDRPTDQQTDSVTYRAAIGAKNISHIKCHNTDKLITAL